MVHIAGLFERNAVVKDLMFKLSLYVQYFSVVLYIYQVKIDSQIV